MERNATFATVVSTGEQPDATIHMALFNDGDSSQVIGEQRGGGRDLAHLAAQVVANLVKSLQKNDSAVTAASSVMIVMQAINEASNIETKKCVATFQMQELEKLVGDHDEEEADE